MGTTVNALKDLYVSLGGELSNVENLVTIPDMIQAISALGGGGDSAIKVRDDGNGNVEIYQE